MRVWQDNRHVQHVQPPVGFSSFARAGTIGADARTVRYSLRGMRSVVARSDIDFLAGAALSHGAALSEGQALSQGQPKMSCDRRIAGTNYVTGTALLQGQVETT